MKPNKTPKDQKFCIFCGGGKLTKEHIFPNWLKALLPASENNSQSVVRQFTDHENKTCYLYPELLKPRQGPLNQRKLRKVCNVCNNGWMSRAVDRAKPYVIPLITNGAIRLDEAAQHALAAWLAITTIMAEYTDVPTLAISEKDRESLYKTSSPPQSWSIHLGRYMGKDWAPIRYRHFGAFAVDASQAKLRIKLGASSPNLQLTTVVIGSLLVQVFTAHDLDMVDYFRESHLPEGMVPIWPLGRPIHHWPLCAPKVFDDAAVSKMAEAFNHMTMEVPSSASPGLIGKRSV